MTRRITTLAFLLLTCSILAGVVLAKPQPARQKTWAVYYSDALPFSRFTAYDILAFDSDHYPDFSATRKPEQVILGYLSTSEAEAYRPYYGDIRRMGVLMRPSALWKEHTVIDIRKPAWRDYFVHTLVPAVLAKGFDGIMLDTIDTVLYLEEEHPKTYKGMREAAITLLADLRRAHPQAKLMLNRGFPILAEAAPYIDYLLAESIRVEYDFDKKTSRYFPQEDYAGLVADLKAAQLVNPQLEIVTLDYWNTSGTDAATARNIYAEQRSHGFIPYVTSVDLMSQHAEP